MSDTQKGGEEAVMWCRSVVSSDVLVTRAKAIVATPSASCRHRRKRKERQKGKKGEKGTPEETPPIEEGPRRRWRGRRM